jgi:hypothetical protein
MKRIALALAVVMVAAGIVSAGNVPPNGLTGLWRFEDATTQETALKATIGVDLQSSNLLYNTFPTGTPWIHMGTDQYPDLYTDNKGVQETSWQYLIVNPSFTPNGGSADYVNSYTVAIDYRQTQRIAYNSLFQTAWDGNAGEGDLWIKSVGGDVGDQINATIGAGAVGGYSDLTFDANQLHRIMWSVQNQDVNGNGGFFRVYVDGTLFLDKPGQLYNDTYALYPDRFNLFADDSWEDAWGEVATVAVWNEALTTPQIAAMGGVNTPLTIPEPSTLVLVVAGLATVFVIRRKK